MGARLRLICVGFAMGIAEIIPGVSGGTIAFISGIYEELINTVKSFNISLLKKIGSFQLKEAWTHANGGFLLSLISGMVIGIGFGIVAVSYLIEHYPEPLWAMFFGLILASSVYIGRQVKQWNLITILMLVIGFISSYIITTLNPSAGAESYLYILLCGAIAISALLLPGISGSFILLLMGMYFVIIPELKLLATAPNMDSFMILAVFGIGCLIGLVTFSRVLSWTFKNYKFPTLALLTGFILGSLRKIWPWKHATQIQHKETGAIVDFPQSMSVLQNDSEGVFKILKEENVLPPDYLLGDPRVVMVVIALMVGMLLVYLLSKLGEEG